MKIIQTDRLILRPLKIEDITPAYVSALNDADVTLLTESRHKSWDLVTVQKYVEASSPQNSELIGIFLKKSLRHIGNIRLFNFHQYHKRVELGIMIFAKDQWSKGFGTESLVATENYVFNELGLYKICADYYSINTGSAKIFKKVLAY